MLQRHTSATVEHAGKHAETLMAVEEKLEPRIVGEREMPSCPSCRDPSWRKGSRRRSGTTRDAGEAVTGKCTAGTWRHPLRLLVKSPLGASMHAQVLVDSRLHREPDEIYQREPDEFLGGVSQWQIAK